MKLAVFAFAALVAVAYGAAAVVPTTPEPTKTLEQRLKDMEDLVATLSRQVMVQQFFVEEKARSDGDSGIKQIRVTQDGNKNYHSTAHIDTRFLAMHDHANYDRTVGMGELMVVMNGVEFRTRHNDYKLRMPSQSQDYKAMENIPYPDVPKSVTDQPTVEDQILEMREYFRAFKDQNITHRDYRPYFKPVLCYIEGGWTTGSKDINEPFQSDRHEIDATSWHELMDKIRYTSYTGTKSVSENYAYLPTTIMTVENGVPQYAQWNYRILCHPLKNDLPLSVFEIQDDLLYRFPQRKPMGRVENSRGARFVLNRKENDHFSRGDSLLDDLMYEIPGKDNYNGELHDTSFDMELEDIHYDNHTLINTAFYHRYFKTRRTGAMGNKDIRRGFSDANLFVAQTSQPQIAPMSVTNCEGRNCKTWSARYTYALPLEIVYMTPLFKWNPYDVATDLPTSVVRDSGTRTGGRNLDKAFNGTNYKNFYLTPADFYSSQSVGQDPADTARGGAGVLDKDGNLRVMSSSGQRIITPPIEGVGQVRLRYPIAPIHGEGAGVWKELNALKDMTMHMNRYASLFEERPGITEGGNYTDNARIIHFMTTSTVRDPPGEHSHDFFINAHEKDEILNKGGIITVTTSEDLGHSHELVLKADSNGKIVIKTCDGLDRCWDGHGTRTFEVEN